MGIGLHQAVDAPVAGAHLAVNAYHQVGKQQVNGRVKKLFGVAFGFVNILEVVFDDLPKIL